MRASTAPIRTSPLRFPQERKYEDALCHRLEALGIPYQRQVRTSCGIADVVTETTVYELKTILTQGELSKAFGQVTLYALALGKQRRVIVGRRCSATSEMDAFILAQGVEINACP